MRTLRKGLPALLLLCVGFLAAACQSTLQGDRMDGDTDVRGVPFALLKPEYTLTIAPSATAGKSPTYTLNVAYVPDATQMYTLRLDPSWFADPTFTMKLSKGALTGVNAGVSDQLGPTITALGQFTSSVIGALSTFAADIPSAKSQLKDAVDATDARDIKDGTTRKCDDSVRASIQAQSDLYATDDLFVATFHPLNSTETECLKDAKVYSADQYKSRDQTIDDAWTAELAKYKTAHEKDGDLNSFLDQVTLYATAGDAEALAKMGKASTGDKRALISAAGSEAKNALLKVSQKLVATLADLSLDAWITRHVAYLDLKIEIERMKLAMSPADTAAAEAIATFELEQARVMGAEELWQRRLKLAKFLADIRQKDVQGGTAPATAEYATARTELDAVDQKLADTRAKYTPKDKGGSSDSADASANPIPLTVINQTDVDNSKLPGWASGSGANKQDYALLLEEVGP